MFLLGMPNKNSLKANLLPHHYPQPCLPSTCLCILFCAVAEVMGVSIQEEARGLWSSSSSPRPSSPYAPQLPFRTPPLQPIHLGKLPPPTPQKKWLFIRILVCYCSAPHKRVFIVLEASPLSQRETITWNCLFRVYNKCHFFLSLPLSVC